MQKSCFSKIYEAPAGFLCDIRNERAEYLDEIVTDDKEIFDKMQEYLGSYQIEDVKKLRFYEDESYPLEKLYGIEDKLSKALHKNVWLKSGGTLVIEPTEALTVIDVNTGKAIKGNKKMQETFWMRRILILQMPVSLHMHLFQQWKRYHKCCLVSIFIITRCRQGEIRQRLCLL